MLYLVGLFGIFALLTSIRIFIRPAFGKEFFRDWHDLQHNVARLVVTTVLIASSWATSWPNLIFAAGCFVATATAFFAIAGRSPRGRDFVHSYLVESKWGPRVYTICAVIPMGALLVAGTLIALTG